MQHNGIPVDAIEAQLCKILASALFSKADRASRFLHFAVRQSLEGKSSELKEYVVGVEVMGRKPDFDPRVDTIVRAEAQRLRARLEEYYASVGKHDSIRISIPKGSYVPSFELNGAPVQTERLSPITAPDRRTMWWIVPSLIAALALGAASAWWSSGRRNAEWHNPLEGATFTRLTDFPGVETDAAVSPDGNFVTFVSDRDGSMDVWGLQLGSGQFINLTKGKVILGPLQRLGFTPDGSQVTMFTTSTRALDGTGVLGTSIVPTIGGTARLLLDGRLHAQWSPDGSRLLFFQIQGKDNVYTADRDGSNPRRVFPEKSGAHNHYLTWSPNGRYIYFARSTQTFLEFDIWRVPALGGAPERITHHNSYVGYPAFLDDHTLLYIAADENGSGTWLYTMDLNRRVEHRLGVGIEQYLSIAASAPLPGQRRRLVATVSNPAGALWSIPITDSVEPESAATTYAVPSAGVSAPRFSKDYLLYLSSRALADGLWKLQEGVASELWRASEGAILAAPGVSRDGRQIAIAALKEGHPALFVMTAEGTNPQQLAPSLQVREEPSWSPDGNTIAVSGIDSRGPGLFLVPTNGGDPVRVYGKSCRFPLWSPDGRYILFSEELFGPQMQLKAITSDGKPVPLPEIRTLRLAQLPKALSPYRFMPDGKSLVMQIGPWRLTQFWLVNLKTGDRRQLTDLRPGRPIRSFDVTRDGRKILFDRVQENADIVLIDLPGQPKQ